MKQKIYALDVFFIEKLKLSDNDPTMASFVPIRGRSLFHVVICLFRVSSCDRKNIKLIFIPCDVLWNELRVFYFPEPLASYGLKIHLRSYIFKKKIYVQAEKNKQTTNKLAPV